MVLKEVGHHWNNKWETQWDKVFSFALIQIWQNSMSFSLPIKSLIKSTEHALNVTAKKKHLNTKQNKTYVLALSKENKHRNFQLFFFRNWLLGTRLWLWIEIFPSIVCIKIILLSCISSSMLSISVTSSPLWTMGRILASKKNYPNCKTDKQSLSCFLMNR